MSEQVLDVKGSVRLLRRFWRVVAAFVVAGGAAVASYELVTVPRYHATSLVLLPAGGSSATAPTTRSVTTEGRIATSAAVLVPAGHAADPSLSLADLQARVSVTDAAASVLQITADGPTRQRAESLANAVAAHLVQFLATSGSAANANVLTALHAESHQLNGQITDVGKELTAAKARVTGGSGESTLVDRLTSQQASLQLQLNSVKSQIAQVAITELAANQGTQVIQRATTATPPSRYSLVLPVLLGALGGLLVGSIVVLAWRRHDPRIRTRDALAETLGAPVLGALHVHGRRSAADWAGLLEEYRPSALEQWHVRRALRELGVHEDGAPALAVVALADDAAGLAQAVHVAVAASVTGSDTSLAVAAPEGAATALRAACARYQDEDRAPRPGLVVADPAAARTPGVDLAVTTVVAGDGGLPMPPGAPGTPTVLSVSAGAATAQQLAAVAVAAADAGCPVRGVLVANPTSSDQTVGRFMEAGARTARIRQEVTHA